jgi:hypothetical protein
VTWHQTAATTGGAAFDLVLRTPTVLANPPDRNKGNMWPAVGVVPWLCWADNMPSGQQLAMLARHWGVLAALGIEGPPALERWTAALQLAVPSVPAAHPQQEEEEGGEDEEEEDEEEEESSEGEEDSSGELEEEDGEEGEGEEGGEAEGEGEEGEEDEGEEYY